MLHPLQHEVISGDRLVRPPLAVEKCPAGQHGGGHWGKEKMKPGVPGSIGRLEGLPVFRPAQGHNLDVRVCLQEAPDQVLGEGADGVRQPVRLFLIDKPKSYPKDVC